MPAAAQNALEPRPASVTTVAAQILVNQEINATCRFTKACGERCILAQTNAEAGTPLDTDEVLGIAQELVSGRFSRYVRHYGMVGMEPTESPERMLAIARMWHNTPQAERCGTIGAISASIGGLRELAPQFADQGPLSWVLSSADVSSTGLRVETNNAPLLKELVEARRIGGIGAFGVNTQLTSQNQLAVIGIGRKVAEASADQWSVGPFLQPKDGVMSPTVGAEQVRQFIEKIVTDPVLSRGPMAITIDMDLPMLMELVGAPHRLVGSESTWRYEYPVTRYLTLIALNPTPGHFLRIRWDGELISMEDFTKIGLRFGSLGHALPGRATELLRRFSIGKTSQAANFSPVSPG